MTRWIITAALGLGLSLGACGNKTPAEQPAAAEKAPEGEAKPADKAAEVPADKAAEAPGDEAAEKAADEKVADEGVKAAEAGDEKPADGAMPEGRERLEKAYLDVYCAQRAGKTDELYDLYRKYGFEEPKAWTDAWTEAAKDKEWVAKLTHDAMKACP